MIVSLPGVFVPRNQTWHLDFLITYDSRAGVIEVAGPHHGRETGGRRTRVAVTHWRTPEYEASAASWLRTSRKKEQVDQFVRDFLDQLTAM